MNKTTPRAGSITLSSSSVRRSASTSPARYFTSRGGPLMSGLNENRPQKPHPPFRIRALVCPSAVSPTRERRQGGGLRVRSSWTTNSTPQWFQSPKRFAAVQTWARGLARRRSDREGDLVRPLAPHRPTNERGDLPERKDGRDLRLRWLRSRCQSTASTKSRPGTHCKCPLGAVKGRWL
jgi:hypothetical protein